MNWDKFASEHYFLFFIILYALLEGTIKLINRVLRTIKVVTRGWPTAPIDADGDIIYPEEPVK